MTLYELCYFSEEKGASSYFLFASEISTILLIAYSSFNPLAYCGGLILQVFAKGYFRCVRRSNAEPADLIDVSQALPRTDRRSTLKYKVKWTRRLDTSDLSEYDAMKSIGITLNGPDSLDVQLNDLDPQSRIMCGLSRNGSSTESNSSASVVFLPKFKRFHSISA